MLDITENNRKFLKEFERDSQGRKLSLFLGAGLDADAGFPGLLELLKPAARELEIKLDSSMNLFDIAQYYETQTNRKHLIDIVKEGIGNNLKQSKLVDAIVKLESKSIWTTNYDKMIEDKLNKLNISSQVIFEPKQLSSITDGKTHVIKVNGDIDNIESIAITSRDLQLHAEKNELLFELLTKELITNEFLFVGYSFSDQLVLRRLNRIRKILGDYGPTHFCIQKIETSDVQKAILQRNFCNVLQNEYGIETYFVKDYKEFPSVINRLRETLIKRNVFISGSLWNPTQKETALGYALTQRLAKSLFQEGLNIHTGLGMNVGNYLTGEALKYLQENNVILPETRLKIEPFALQDTTENKEDFRAALLDECKVFIFMFGKPKKGQNVKDSGVFKEYQKAWNKYQDSAVYIPVVWTRYSAKAILQDMVSNHSINRFPYLQTIYAMKGTPTVQQMVDTVMDAVRQGLEFVDRRPQA